MKFWKKYQDTELKLVIINKYLCNMQDIIMMICSSSVIYLIYSRWQPDAVARPSYVRFFNLHPCYSIVSGINYRLHFHTSTLQCCEGKGWPKRRDQRAGRSKRRNGLPGQDFVRTQAEESFGVTDHCRYDCLLSEKLQKDNQYSIPANT